MGIVAEGWNAVRVGLFASLLLGPTRPSVFGAPWIIIIFTLGTLQRCCMFRSKKSLAILITLPQLILGSACFPLTSCEDGGLSGTSAGLHVRSIIQRPCNVFMGFDAVLRATFRHCLVRGCWVSAPSTRHFTRQGFELPRVKAIRQWQCQDRWQGLCAMGS
jgi:hypothetical protein